MEREDDLMNFSPEFFYVLITGFAVFFIGLTIMPTVELAFETHEDRSAFEVFVCSMIIFIVMIFFSSKTEVKFLDILLLVKSFAGGVFLSFVIEASCCYKEAKPLLRKSFESLLRQITGGGI